jgi:hypothetical protein
LGFEWRFLDGETSQFPCPEKNFGEHSGVEAAGVGVAERGVVRGEQVEAVGEEVVGAVGEAVFGFAGYDSGLEQEGKVAVEGDLAKADDDADAGEGLDFGGQVGSAIANLLGVGLVAGRGAADDGGDPCVAELEAVVAGDGAGLTGEAQLVEDGVHEVAGAVSGEGAAGAVGSVGARGEAEDKNSCFGVSEPGDGTGPVGVVLVGSAFGLADAAAVVAEAGAALADDDGFVNLLKYLGRNLCVGGCHCIP